MFRSAALDTSDRFTYTFAQPGEFAYYCTLHPMMVGKIVVKAGRRILVSSSRRRPGNPVAAHEEGNLHGAASELTFGDGITAAQIRVARPTDRLDEVVAFYRDGLGLPELYRFADHDGYDGVMIGLPGRTYPPRIHDASKWQRRNRSEPRQSSRVLYTRSGTTGAGAATGSKPWVIGRWLPENPYWLDKSVTFEDPDGWRIVLCQTAGI